MAFSSHGLPKEVTPGSGVHLQNYPYVSYGRRNKRSKHPLGRRPRRPALWAAPFAYSGLVHTAGIRVRVHGTAVSPLYPAVSHAPST